MKWTLGNIPQVDKPRHIVRGPLKVPERCREKKKYVKSLLPVLCVLHYVNRIKIKLDAMFLYYHFLERSNFSLVISCKGIIHSPNNLRKYLEILNLLITLINQWDFTCALKSVLLTSFWSQKYQRKPVFVVEQYSSMHTQTHKTLMHILIHTWF